jgi:hypothetical protein
LINRAADFEPSIPPLDVCASVLEARPAPRAAPPETIRDRRFSVIIPPEKVA